jgi:hypothetical protein
LPYSVILEGITRVPGVGWYYRKFMRYFGIISKLLTNLPKKHNYGWNAQAQQAFISLKKALCEAPVLALPDFSQDICSGNHYL